MDMWGFEYDIAMNGLEAVEFATVNEGKYDLCLMDVDMPKMNGLEATGIIRKRLQYLPIMAMTGNAGYKRKCIKLLRFKSNQNILPAFFGPTHTGFFQSCTNKIFTGRFNYTTTYRQIVLLILIIVHFQFSPSLYTTEFFQLFFVELDIICGL